MGNLVDYLETELATFSEKPFSAVDSLVLSQLAYFRVRGLAPEAFTPGVPLAALLRAENFSEMLTEVYHKELNRRFFYALAASPRFRTLELGGIADEWSEREEKQFAAMTVRLEDGTAYVAFRGTDTTLLGWKEDFALAFRTPVPSQTAAAEYLQRAAQAMPGPLLVGGHSKGGNLAVYAAMMSPPETLSRIGRIYSHDGPGFPEELLQSAGFHAVSARIDKTLPQSSLIGMLLQSQERYRVIRSTGVGVMQHDPFSWEIVHGGFVPVEGLSVGARYMDRTLNAWIAGMAPDEREQFTQTLYEIFQAGGVDSFADPDIRWRRAFMGMLRAARALPPDKKEMMTGVVKALARIAAQNLPLVGSGQV